MSDWQKVKLTEIYEISSGLSKPAEAFGSGHPFVSFKNVFRNCFIPDELEQLVESTDKERQKCSVKKGDVFLTRTSETMHELGMSSVALKDYPYATFNGFTKRLREKDKHGFDVLPEYIGYYLRSPKFRTGMLAFSTMSTRASLNNQMISQLDIELPPISVQKTIADALKRLDEKIQLNRQTNQTLEAIAQAIFKSWFVDFDPTRAKIAANECALARTTGASTVELIAQLLEDGRWTKKQAQTIAQGDPELAAMSAISGQFVSAVASKGDETQEQNPQLTAEKLEELSQTAALFPSVLVDSELGEIPEGWQWSEIGNEVTVVGGGTPSTKKTEYWDGGTINWTSPRDMSNLTDKVLTQTDRQITKEGLAKISSGLLPVGTVLMSSRAPVGYLAITKIPVAINQGYIAMKCEKTLSSEYVVQWANSVMADIKQRASGTTFAEISKKNFKIIPVLVPSEHLVNQYANYASDLYGKISVALNETKMLSESRDLLLPKLLSGDFL